MIDQFTLPAVINTPTRDLTTAVGGIDEPSRVNKAMKNNLEGKKLNADAAPKSPEMDAYMATVASCTEQVCLKYLINCVIIPQPVLITVFQRCWGRKGMLPAEYSDESKEEVQGWRVKKYYMAVRGLDGFGLGRVVEALFGGVIRPRARSAQNTHTQAQLYCTAAPQPTVQRRSSAPHRPLQPRTLTQSIVIGTSVDLL